MSAMTWDRLRQEPYRLLFPLGIVFGCLGVIHWLLFALGVADASPHYHAAMQLGAYLYCFIAGFLWTALPRMTAAPAASTRELGGMLVLLAGQAVLLAFHQEILGQLCFVGLLILLVAFAARRLGGGVTGDVYGAAVETAEIAALLSFVGLIGAIAPVWA